VTIAIVALSSFLAGLILAGWLIGWDPELSHRALRMMIVWKRLSVVELGAILNVSPQRLYGVMRNLEAMGVLTSVEEPGDPARGGRPRRIYISEVQKRLN
jgi:predicted ArsR family transcriptional regulator